MTKSTVQQERSSFLFSTFLLSASMLLVKVIGAFFKIPLMNLLGETGMAYFSGAYTVFTAVYAVTVSGLTGASAKLFSAYDALRRRKDIRRLQKLTLWLYGGIGAVGTAVMLLGAKAFASWIGCELSAPATRAASAAVFFCCLMAAYRGYFEGMNDMLPTALSQIVEACSKLFFGLFGAFWVLYRAKNEYATSGTVFGQNADSLQQAVSIAMPYAAAAVLLGISLSTFLGLCCLWGMKRLDRRQMAQSQTEAVIPVGALLSELTAAAFPITVSTVMMQLIPLIDTTTIFRGMSRYFQANPAAKQQIQSILAAGEDVETFCFGIFSACVTLFNLIPTIAGLISKTALPAVSRLTAVDDREQTSPYIRAVLTCALYITVPASLGMSAIARLILQVLYARQPYTAVYGEQTLQILGLAALCSGIVFPLAAILQAGKHFWTPVFCQLSGAAVKLVGNLLFIPMYGMRGAAYATFAGYLVMTLGMMVAGYRYYQKMLAWFDAAKILLLGTISAAGARICCRMLKQYALPEVFILGISMLIAAGIYLLGTFFCNPITKNTINLLSGKEKTRKGLEKIRIIR